MVFGWESGLVFFTRLDILSVGRYSGAMQEEESQYLLAWLLAVFEIGLRSFGTKELEEGYRVTGWLYKVAGGAYRRGAGRATSQSLRTGSRTNQKGIVERLRRSSWIVGKRKRSSWIAEETERSSWDRWEERTIQVQRDFGTKKSSCIYTS